MIWTVPYELSFRQRVSVKHRDEYINECCIGGDAVVDRLLPTVQRVPEHTKVWTNQEDWGWFIWFQKGSVHLAIDVYTDDAEAGEFRIRLTSSVKRYLWSYREVDTPELEELRTAIVEELKLWTGRDPQIERV
jgi:hypothetical protein